jgi:hypothetical protein
MNDRLYRTARRWIALESEAGADEADAAFAALFEQLPLASPSAGFAERVLAESGLLEAEPARPFWPWRLPLAASLLLAGLAAAILPSILVQLLDPLSGIRLLEWSAALFLGLVHRLSDGLSIWSGMVEAARGTRLAFSNTPMLTAVLAALILTSTAFGALYGLLRADRRRSEYVH